MQKGTATLFLLIAGLVTVVLIGVFFSGLLKPQVSLIPQLSLKIPTPTPKVLTYTNQTLGFGFQYPSKDFAVKDDSEEEFNKRGNGDFRKNFKGYVGYEPGKPLGAVVVLDQNNHFDKNPLTIWVFDNPDNLTVEGWFGKYWYYPFIWGVFDFTSKGHIALDKEATISGQLAKYKIVSYQPGSPKFMYIARNNRMYLFRIIGSVGDQILATFRFLDSNSQ